MSRICRHNIQPVTTSGLIRLKNPNMVLNKIGRNANIVIPKNNIFPGAKSDSFVSGSATTLGLLPNDFYFKWILLSLIKRFVTIFFWCRIHHNHLCRSVFLCTQILQQSQCKILSKHRWYNVTYLGIPMNFL